MALERQIVLQEVLVARRKRCYPQVRDAVRQVVVRVRGLAAQELGVAEEQKRRCLLTGDAAEEEILEGLEAAGRIVDGRLWCNVVKVQHHGSEHNLSQVFASTVLADDYVLCGDGAHGNPEPSVIKTIIETRRAADARPFTIWFNCSPARTAPDRRKALRAAIREATKAAAKDSGITVKVLDDAKASHDISV